ncbi:dTDP-4-dehydrorhamnose 3,5-epimerase family protein [Salinibacterium sp. ZJ450]|uniref:dTDP-4-dehydrorhamnose 3,5-epimerase family protein n=1 Tax=Salinibacterium sp. ZJ450 TaxID=2708338 RepID=UPI001423B341|nr:dTDP-4-dehydrorhamnose 3,5-epimerase [Salinibacterium sp. ZJ450]
MQIRELSIPDAYVITPQQFGDDRGTFLEWYRFDKLGDTVGRPLDLRQANTSVSKRGVVRGIHFVDVPPGQAKYVTVAHGAVLDFVVDIRVGSPTFGQWDSVLLDHQDRRAVYLSEGLGHAFVALTDDATVTYLVSDVYNPGTEHAINPLDPEVGLVFPADAGELLLSEKDTQAPGLSESVAAGLLPTWEATRDYYDSMSKVEG